MAVFWVVLVIPSLLWWKDSIVFVILISLYANFEASLGAWHAKRSEEENRSESEPAK